ncbi:MAG: tyrosine-type recombinase/integrase [Ignavibacteriales bacterium]|nr:tyrosine-type recombinase/integrase [Ignavibacteriales bacterium]
MFLFLRDGYYHLEYFDEVENRIRRISTRCKKKTEAISFLTDFNRKLSNKPKLKFILLHDFSNLYLQQLEKTHSQNYKAIVKISFALLEKGIGNIPITQISVRQLEKYFADTYQRTKQGARTYYIALRSAFNKAISWNYISENPISKIKLPKIPKNNPLFINEVELNLIIGKEDNPQLKDVYSFAFHTGMRLAEITNLKWNQIDLVERIIKVTNTADFTTKGKKERIIPINERMFLMLTNRLPKIMDINKDVYLFNRNGIKYNDEFISKQFKKAVRKINIDSKFHFHSLRHSFASNLIMKGIPIYTVMELLGHSDIKTTQIYSHLKVENLREAVKVLEY